MGLQISRDIVLADEPFDWSTFSFGGTDRVDVRAKGNPVALELRRFPMSPWDPPIIIDTDDFESVSGLAIAYKPRGVASFRLYNATPGKQATATVRSYGVG